MKPLALTKIKKYVLQSNKILCSKDIELITGYSKVTVNRNIKKMLQEGFVIPVAGTKHPVFYTYVTPKARKKILKEKRKREIRAGSEWLNENKDLFYARMG